MNLKFMSQDSISQQIPTLHVSSARVVKSATSLLLLTVRLELSVPLVKWLAQPVCRVIVLILKSYTIVLLFRFYCSSLMQYI